jgi:hypothetical protein
MKVDVLALGMLTCIRKSFDLMERHGLGRYALASVPREDEPTFDMLCRGDSVGTFQVESRAQMAMLPRMKPRVLYDLVIQVAIVRPGPIQGGMVHPYLRRRNGEEKVVFPGPPGQLQGVLAKTLGVPLFQEQAMKLAIVAAGFTPPEADGLRRAMATFRNHGTVTNYAEKFIGGMVKNGYPEDFAERCFEQIKGFGEYGFPESHAQAFGWLAYVSSWLKCHYPGVFTCALLNSQPMGFYAPAQLVRDAREHGVVVHGPDVNASWWDCTLDAPRTLRLGLRLIDGFHEDWAAAIARARIEGPFMSPEDLARRADLPTRALALLADGDAMGSLGRTRREAGWDVRRVPPRQLPLFAALDAPELAAEPDAALPAMPRPRKSWPITRPCASRSKAIRCSSCATRSPGRGVHLRAGQCRQGRAEGARGRRGAGAAAAGQGQRRVHHSGRRDRRGQRPALGARFRETAPPGHGRAADGDRRRSAAQQGRRGPPDGRAGARCQRDLGAVAGRRGRAGARSGHGPPSPAGARVAAFAGFSLRGRRCGAQVPGCNVGLGPRVKPGATDLELSFHCRPGLDPGSTADL